MTDQPNPEDFSYVDKPNEFNVVMKVEGEIWKTIIADDAEQAWQQAEKMADDIVEGRNFADLDDIYDVGILTVRGSPRMYRVTDKNGKDMQVSQLKPGMKPREPHENGF